MISKDFVIVTGASRGLGKSLALRLLADGFSVLGVSRTGSDISHKSYLDFKLDISDQVQVLKFFSDVSRNKLNIHGLINCSGISKSALAVMESPKEMRRIYETNVFGTFSMCSSVSKIMIRNKSGVIINIGSVLVNMHLSGGISYTTSKAAVAEMSKILATELYDYNIKVYCVNLSPFESDMLDDQQEKFKNAIFDRMLLKKPIGIEELYPWVLILLQTENNIFSGNIFNVGMH